MRVEIKIEELGFGLTEATLVCWISDVGDIVYKDQPILELFCDKEIFDLLSPEDGIIQETFFRSGETVGIGDVLGIIETEIESFYPVTPRKPQS